VTSAFRLASLPLPLVKDFGVAYFVGRRLFERQSANFM
jgi:hypothetical protein